MKKLISILGAVAIGLTFQAGCVSVFPEPKQSSPALSAETSSNVVIATEKTLKVSKDSIDLFLHLEYDNRALVKSQFPQVHAFAETLRSKAPDALITANNAKNNFKHNRNASNQANLMTAVAVVSDLAAQAQAFTNKINRP